MGLQLLARNTRSVELTLAGEHFLPQARRMLRDMDDAVRDARDTLSLSRGSLRLAALPTAAASFLPVVIASFQREHPGVRVSVLRSEEHTSELQSLMRISYAVFCLKKKKQIHNYEVKT